MENLRRSSPVFAESVTHSVNHSLSLLAPASTLTQSLTLRSSRPYHRVGVLVLLWRSVFPGGYSPNGLILWQNERERNRLGYIFSKLNGNEGFPFSFSDGEDGRGCESYSIKVIPSEPTEL